MFVGNTTLPTAGMSVEKTVLPTASCVARSPDPVNNASGTLEIGSIASHCAPPGRMPWSVNAYSTGNYGFVVCTDHSATFESKWIATLLFKTSRIYCLTADSRDTCRKKSLIAQVGLIGHSAVAIVTASRALCGAIIQNIVKLSSDFAILCYVKQQE